MPAEASPSLARMEAWGGALLMAFGGLVSLTDRRWRIGVAVTRRCA